MSDWMLVVLATFFGFTAYIVRFAGGSWEASAVVAAIALAVLLVGIARGRSNRQLALVGTRGGGRLGPLEYGLDEAGYGVRYCPGPGDEPCPVLAGGPCRISGHPVAVLVYTDGEDGALPPCGRALNVPVIAVEESRGAPATSRADAAAVVRWRDGAAAADSAVRRTIGGLLTP